MVDELITQVSIDRYVQTTGLVVPHDRQGSQLVGYCSNPPEEVFRVLFPEFYVTSFRGFGLFDSDKYNYPMKGLSIYGGKPIVGINGGIEKIMAIPEVEALRRDKSKFEWEVGEILKNLRGEYDPSEDKVSIENLNAGEGLVVKYASPLGIERRKRREAVTEIIEMVSSFK